MKSKTNPFVWWYHRRYIYKYDLRFPDDEMREIHQCQVHYHFLHLFLSNEIEFSIIPVVLKRWIRRSFLLVHCVRTIFIERFLNKIDIIKITYLRFIHMMKFHVQCRIFMPGYFTWKEKKPISITLIRKDSFQPFRFESIKTNNWAFFSVASLECCWIFLKT